MNLLKVQSKGWSVIRYHLIVHVGRKLFWQKCFVNFEISQHNTRLLSSGEPRWLWEIYERNLFETYSWPVLRYLLVPHTSVKIKFQFQL